MTPQQTVKNIVAKIGLGFHPDTPIADYVDPDGEPYFGEVEARLMQTELDAAHAQLGDELYDVTWYAVRELIKPTEREPNE